MPTDVVRHKRAVIAAAQCVLREEERQEAAEGARGDGLLLR